jgi:hypothetical protein
VFISVKLGDFYGEPEDFDAEEQLEAVLSDVSDEGFLQRRSTEGSWAPTMWTC